ncbi:GNAT family N-acetyltransferase [Paucibacter sp. O1-1]|nr:GNAT family N-acetyltransferase [Paucibacter sp. O1-1]MDA3828799.1 GNAT family N-acetyltransferase [Paucibacter sp. O1-1]
MRSYLREDAPKLYRIYFDAIHRTAAPFYSPDQRRAWAPSSIDAYRWAERLSTLQPFVACESGEPVGYADLQPDGYIDHFFVAPAAGSRGVGGLLMQRLLERARELGLGKMWADVSRSAERFFERHGFELVARSSNPIRGVAVPNARMQRHAVLANQGQGL